MSPRRQSEDQIISRWTRNWPGGRHLATGPGDDCALLCPVGKKEFIVLKTDAVVQNVHFKLDVAPRLIGAKAVNRVLSDFAAMGATPLTVLVTVGLPDSLAPDFVRKCYVGMMGAARKYGVSLAGGETTRSGELWFNVAGMGRVGKAQAVLRSGAKPDDSIFVTGTLGGSRDGKHLAFSPRLAEGQWLARSGFATAMMDLSDGLGKDLPRLAKSSGVSFSLDPGALPVTRGCTVDQSVNDGEDYELLFTARASRSAELQKKWPFRTRLTCVGRIEKPSRKYNTGGLKFSGFDHFLT